MHREAFYFQTFRMRRAGDARVTSGRPFAWARRQHSKFKGGRDLEWASSVTVDRSVEGFIERGTLLGGLCVQ